MSSQKTLSSPASSRKSSGRSTGAKTISGKGGTGSRRGASRSAKPWLKIKLPKNLFPGLKPRPILTNISPEHKLDLLGTLLALLGLLTLFSLLSTNRGSLTGWWITTLCKLVGWGAFFLPAGFLIVGLWLILRNVERLPQFAIERLVGLFLLYFNLLAFLDLLSGSSLTAIEAGQGGGYTGNLILRSLTKALGGPGAVIALLAWLLISLTLTLDLSIPEIFRWVPPLLRRFQSFFASLAEKREQQATFADTADEFDDPDPDTLPAEFTPLSRADIETGAQPEPVVKPKEVSAPVKSETPPAAESDLPEPPHPPWILPQIETILEPGVPQAANDELDQQRASVIEETLASFGAPGHVVEVHRGPTITQFGIEPDFIENRNGRTRVRVSKIVSLADDLSLALAAARIRIQAPVPGHSYVGIEVPNGETSKVVMRDVIESQAFQNIKSTLKFTIGKDVAGKPIATDLAAMPHLLIAGTTGSGKSVCVNAILSCLLINNTPDDLRLILVDPKRVELTGYNGIPHLLVPVVVDAERVVGALQWMLREMDSRYHKFAQIGARNIVDYNAKLMARGERKIPYLVVVIDELADLMMLAPDETERTITRLAQLARATGIHLILATQRPSVDVLTGLIKANFPARIAFAVASGVDSRVILDQPGAERLLGRGDMLFQAPDAPAPVRLQGVFVSDAEIQRLTTYWRSFTMPETAAPVSSGSIDSIPSGVPLKQGSLWDEVDMEPKEEQDPMLKEATDLVRREGRASISMLQRRLRIGYTRAARIIDTLEEKGIIGPSQANSQVREVLDYGPTAPPPEEK